MTGSPYEDSPLIASIKRTRACATANHDAQTPCIQAEMPVVIQPASPNHIFLVGGAENAERGEDATPRHSGPHHPTAKEKRARNLLRFLSNPIPLRMTPQDFSIDTLYHQVNSEFPWFHNATYELLSHIASSHANNSPLSFPPILLSGQPGIGKTRWAKKIAGITDPRASIVIPLAGVSTTMNILGCDQVYEGSCPGGWYDAIQQSQIANPIMVLDEIDKTAGVNFNPAMAYLSFLEKENARQFFCPYFRKSLDLSTINYICTANDIKAIPQPLIDRMIEVKCPLPKWRDIEARIPSFVNEAMDGKVPPETYAPDMDQIRAVFERQQSLRGIIKEIQRQVGLSTWTPPPSDYRADNSITERRMGFCP